MTVLDSRALRGRALRVRPATMAEAAELRRLRDVRDAAAAAYDRQVVHLYLVGVSTTSIAHALGVTKQNIGNMIRTRRERFGTERIPRRATG